MKSLRWLFVAAMAFFSSSFSIAQDFLEVDQAFKLQVEVQDQKLLAVAWTIADGYKLYATSLSVKASSDDLSLPSLNLPIAQRTFDKGLNEVVNTYIHQVTGTLRLPSGRSDFVVEVGYQGCAVAGLCYPPQSRSFRVVPLKTGPQEEILETSASPSTTDVNRSEQRSPTPSTSASIEGALKSGSLWNIGLVFFFCGVLLSFTPCVLPMLPILTSIIVGQRSVTRRRSFLLAICYSCGMALVYTGLGVAAGLLGEGLAAFLQKPWVLGMFALLLAVMAFSMFDVYELQLPSSWQVRIGHLSGRFEGGQFISVFMMGALSSLIVGPCVAGPLAGALLYISQTRDVVMGGFALLAMACGMSVPLLLTGLSAGSLLPRSGHWMLHIKSIFGFMLLAVALWMLNPLMNDQVRMMAWGTWLVLAAFFTPLFANRTDDNRFILCLGRTAGFLLMLIGFAEILGALMGNSDMLKPLKSSPSNVYQSAAPARVEFERISSGSALDAIRRNPDLPVALDFYADWCTSCLEMEKMSFTDPQVISAMRGLRRLQVDVTHNTEQDRELMRRMQVFGPPAMLFFKKDGNEVSDSRVLGYMAAPEFLAKIKKITVQND